MATEEFDAATCGGPSQSLLNLNGTIGSVVLEEFIAAFETFPLDHLLGKIVKIIIVCKPF